MTSQIPRISITFPTSLGWSGLVWNGDLLAYHVMGHFSRNAARESCLRHFCQASGQDEPWELRRELWTETIREDLNPKRQMLVRQIIDSADGVPHSFGDVAVDHAGRTKFQIAILEACREIAWGQTKSYGELAAEAGYPRAARAVGNVMARNRCPIVIPCHRVLAAGHRWGGFSAPGGVALKRRMIAMEADSSAYESAVSVGEG